MIGLVSCAPRDKLQRPLYVVETTDPVSLLHDGAYETLRCRLYEAVVQTTVISNALVCPFYGRGRDSRNERSRRAETWRRFWYGAGQRERAGSGCLDSSPRILSGSLRGFAERGAFRFCRGVGRA